MRRIVLVPPTPESVLYEQDVKRIIEVCKANCFAIDRYTALVARLALANRSLTQPFHDHLKPIAPLPESDDELLYAVIGKCLITDT